MAQQSGWGHEAEDKWKDSRIRGRCIFGGKQCMTDEISMDPDEGCFLGGLTGSIEGGLQRTSTGGSLPKCEFLLSSVCAVR